jgi:hypothetical protein
VDVYINRVGKPKYGPESLSLHNGLFGPATSALHALIGAFQDGTLSGPWHSSHIKATVPGTVVRSVLAAVDEGDREFRDGDLHRFLAFRKAIEDSAEYAVEAIEVWQFYHDNPLTCGKMLQWVIAGPLLTAGLSRSSPCPGHPTTETVPGSGSPITASAWPTSATLPTSRSGRRSPSWRRTH